MSTTYTPAGALERGAPLPFASTRYTGAAALHAAILAAAALAPEVSPVVEFRARYLADKYPHTEPGQHETGAALYMRGRDACTIRGGAVFALQIDTDGPACYWPRVDVHPEAPGPFLPLPSDARAVFAYATPDGARGTLTVENLRAPLLALADKVHAKRALFDGKTRRASCPPAVAGSKSSAPHVAARGFWESGQYAEALHLARNVGALFFGASGNEPGAHPYMGAESHEVAGHGFTLARSIRSGRFRVMHTRTGLACDTATAGAPRSDGFTTRGAALDWLESSAACEAWRARLNAAASKAAEFSQAAALAFYLADEPADEPSEAEAAAPATQTTPEAPEAAAPIVAAPEGLASAPAAPGAWARPAAGLLSEAEARGFEALAQTAREAFEARHVAAGLLARFGVSDPAACAHLAAFGPELARIRAEAAAAWRLANPEPDPEPGAPGASAPARRCSVPGMGGAVYRAHCATYARARMLQGLAPIVGGHAAPLDFADPLQLFRAFARFRNPAANALRADVARSIRAERVAARVVAARMLTPTRGISTAAPAPLPRESESCTGLAAWAETARAESSARRETAARLAAGAEFPELAGGSVRFSYPSDPARFGLAGPDMSGADAFRFTYFDAAGPAGHAGALTLAEACAEALSRGYLPIAPEVDPVQVADPLPGKSEASAWRYAMPNRPPHIGAVPRGLAFEVEARPERGAPHHETARHGILVCARMLTPEECKAFELLPIIDGGAALAELAQSVAADLADYAAEYLAQSVAEPSEFRAAVLQRAERSRVSLAEPGALVSAVLDALRASVTPAREFPATPEPAEVSRLAALMAERADSWVSRGTTRPQALRNEAHNLRMRAAALCAPLHPQNAAYLAANGMDPDPGRAALRQSAANAEAAAEQLETMADGGPMAVHSDARPCAAIYSDGSHAITRERAAYLLRAARSRGPSNRPRRTGLHAYAIDGARLRIETGRPAPLPGKLERPAYANQWQAWDEVRAERSEPDPYQAAVIECMGAAKARGLFYNAETYPDAAAQMAARGYPDWRAPGEDNKVTREFGTDCYLAGDVLKLRALKAENRAAADALKLGPLPVLMFSDYKRCTGAVLHSFTHTGDACRVTFKRGRSAFETTCTAAQLNHAIERAAERAGRLAEERERRKPAAPLATHSAPAPDLAALILAAVAARESALTPAGLKHYGAFPAECSDLAAIERAARELVAAGRLGCFEYPGQGTGTAPAFYLPIKAEAPAPLATQSDTPATPTPVPGQSEAKPMQAARVAAVLGKLIRCDGEVMTRREFIARKVAEGLALSTEQQDRVQPMSRMQAFRASNEEQREHDRKVKAAGQKPVYFLGGFEVTKIEHDHAAELIAARVPAESTASAPVVSSEPEVSPAPGIDGLDVAELGADAMAAFEPGPYRFTDPIIAQAAAEVGMQSGARAAIRLCAERDKAAERAAEDAEFDREAAAMPAAEFKRWNPHLTDEHRADLQRKARAAVVGFTPSLRIPAGDPRLRIPARFAPVYILNR